VPAEAGHDVDAGSGAGLSADHEHRARGLVALDRKARALAEQLVEGLVSGSAIRIMCSKALTPSWTYPTCASRPEAWTRSVMAPRAACQITPPSARP
jgi:hypothetical protein